MIPEEEKKPAALSCHWGDMIEGMEDRGQEQTQKSLLDPASEPRKDESTTTIDKILVRNRIPSPSETE